MSKRLKLPTSVSDDTDGGNKGTSREKLIDGRYKVVRAIGHGAAGTVYEGVQLSVDRRVAIKVLKSANYANEDYRERFTREAKAIARLGHTNCIALHDFGHSDEFGSLYMVMEFVDGVELFELINDQKLPFRRALRIAIQISEAVAHAHKRGILHRDLKPENVLVGKDDEVKVLDFGLARMLDLFADDSGRRLTADGAIFGTPAYMSPEQCEGERDVTVHSDIYSLGIILYQLFEGRLPFDAREVVTILVQQTKEPPPPMESLVPNQLKRLIFRMLEKDKTKRPSTAMEVADILRAVLLGVAVDDDQLMPDVSQEIKRSLLRSELDNSREFVIDQTGESRRYTEEGLGTRDTGRNRAVREPQRLDTQHLLGKSLHGRYQIHAELGEGTMSTVFIASDIETNDTVAVKILSEEVPKEFRAPERFAREVDTLQALDHRNIVRMIDHGLDLTLDRPFIVMELASGDTLDTLCEEYRTSLELGVGVAIDIAAALEHAHERGVVHRDLKPSNIMLVPQEDGSVVSKVLDFGLSRLATDQRKLTQHGQIPGTTAFFAPEQLRGESATAAADVYSLGVVLYRMLSGHHPFNGRNKVEMAKAIMRGGASPLASFVQEVPRELSDLIVRMMHRNPKQRPSATEIRSQLGALRDSFGISRIQVQHSGPASDIADAWRLRRRVAPPEQAAQPAPQRATGSGTQRTQSNRTSSNNPSTGSGLESAVEWKPKQSKAPLILFLLFLIVALSVVGYILFVVPNR